MTVLEIVLIVAVSVESVALTIIAIVKLVSRSAERENKRIQMSLDLSLLRDDTKTIARRVLEIEKRVISIENELNGEDEEP